MTYLGRRIGYVLVLNLSVFIMAALADPAAGGNTCVPSDTQKCFQSNQFGVSVDWTSPSASGSAQVLPLSVPDTGLFRFDDPGAAEVLVKVLDGCSLNNFYWVFAAQVSDHGQLLRITETGSGIVKTYSNTLGELPAPLIDTEAFSCGQPLTEPSLVGAGGSPNLMLAGGRFRVSLEWTDLGGSSGIGQGLPVTDRSGAFWFFAPENLEMLVKVVPNIEHGFMGVSFSGMTNVAYTLTVRDTCSGQSRAYANPSGSLSSVTDPTAFPLTCTAEIFSDGFEAGNLSAWAPLSSSASVDATQAVDSRIEHRNAATSKAIFLTQDHDATPPVYVRNFDNWAQDLDLTPMSPWNSSLGHRLAGTLISPRHIIFAAHYLIPIGTTVRFVDGQNNVVDRVMVDRRVHPDYSGSTLFPDLAVGILDSDVPESISFVKVLPDDWQQYIAGEGRLPALCLDQEEKAIVADFRYPPFTNGRVLFSFPDDPKRLEFSESLIGGDSGNPALLILNDELVLVTVWTFGGAGGGTSVFAHKDDINAMMSDLGTDYQLTEIDMSVYEPAAGEETGPAEDRGMAHDDYPFLGNLD